jgi:hypothetical protein
MCPPRWEVKRVFFTHEVFGCLRIWVFDPNFAVKCVIHIPDNWSWQWNARVGSTAVGVRAHFRQPISLLHQSIHLNWFYDIFLYLWQVGGLEIYVLALVHLKTLDSHCIFEAIYVLCLRCIGIRLSLVTNIEINKRSIL